MEHKGAPTVILAKTIKGYGLGEAGEGRNVTHQQKKLNEKELREFRARFGIPISDEEIAETPFYRPPPDSPEMQVSAGAPQGAGRLPARSAPCSAPAAGGPAAGRASPNSSRAPSGSRCRPRWRSCGCSSKLLRNKEIGKQHRARSSRTKRARSAWTRCSARSASIRPKGQLYEPVDSESLLYYHESEGRPDPRGGDHRGGRDVVVHRRRHGLRQRTASAR